MTDMTADGALEPAAGDTAPAARIPSAQAPLALIVDDDPALRMLAREALEEGGLRIEEAEDGEAGLAAFQELRPNIVLLDVMMPRMDGFEACAQLRKLACGVNTPVLMMTGLDDSASIERAYESGATDFITKPISWPILGHRVRYMLRSAQLLKDLARSESSLANAHQLARLASWEWNAQTNLVRWSDRAHLIYGISHLPHNCTFDQFLDSVHPDDRTMLRDWLHSGLERLEPFETDFRIVTPDGAARCVFAQAQATFDDAGKAVEVHGALQDITQRKTHESQIEYLATHDALTDLPNRNLFNDRAMQAISHAERSETGLGLLFIDLDHFKYVNDGYGHPVGDALLKVVANELRSLMRQSDTVARLGGDEFVILLSDLKNAPFDASTAARKVLDRFASPLVVGDHEFTVNASIGISN
jgi:diguanylate cyclase (GGDEF)-like protein